jgi:hypothetical protein
MSADALPQRHKALGPASTAANTQPKCIWLHGEAAETRQTLLPVSSAISSPP